MSHYMPLRALLFIASLLVIGLGLYLLFIKPQGSSSTTLKLAGIGEIKTRYQGLVALVIGALLAVLCVGLDEKREDDTRDRQEKMRQAAASAVAPAPSVSASQVSSGDGSPNIGVNSGSVQISTSRGR